MRRMNFRVKMTFVVSCVNKQPNLSAIAGFVLNSKVEVVLPQGELSSRPT